jgi:uncharacterized membrane protein YkoI
MAPSSRNQGVQVPRISRKSAAVGGAATLLLAGAVGAATAVAADPGDTGLTATDLQQASEAAVDAAGGGRVTDVDVDGTAYEIEVTRDDGTEVTVLLDADRTVVRTSAEPRDTDDGAATATDLQGAADAALEAAGGGRVTDSEADDDGTGYEVEVTRDDGTEVDVRIGPDLTVLATSVEEPDPGDRPLTGTELERAAAAALDAAGGGRVSDTEAEGSGYEIEVVQDDGTEVDVELDAAFTVLELSRDEPGDD